MCAICKQRLYGNRSGLGWNNGSYFERTHRHLRQHRSRLLLRSHRCISRNGKVEIPAFIQLHTFLVIPIVLLYASMLSVHTSTHTSVYTHTQTPTRTRTQLTHEHQQKGSLVFTFLRSLRFARLHSGIRYIQKVSELKQNSILQDTKRHKATRHFMK